MYCSYCDPKFFIVYGYCGVCRRRCFPPLYDPYGTISMLDYEEFRKRWNAERADLISDEIRTSEGYGNEETGKKQEAD